MTLRDLAVFSLLNYFAANDTPLSKLLHAYPNAVVDADLYGLLRQFSRTQPEADGRGYENRAVAGVSFYYNMFVQESPFLPYSTVGTAQPTPTLLDTFKTIVEDRIAGIEGGYVSGGVLGERLSRMICPVPFYFVSHQLELSPEKLFSKFLPADFSTFGNQDPIVVANARTSNTLGAVLLGPAAGEDKAEVLVLKESPYGQRGWGKVYRCRVESSGLSSYTYDELALLSGEEVANIQQLSTPATQPLAFLERETHVVQRSYGLNERQDGLELKGVLLVSPQALFSGDLVT